MMWRRGAPAASALVLASVPLFPAFITMTHVAYPGVSVVPLPAALAVLALMVLLALWATIVLFVSPRTPNPLARPIAMWWCAGLLSAVLGLNPHDGLLFLSIFGLGVIWHVGLVRLYEEPYLARATFWAYMLSGLAASALAIGMVLTRIPAAQFAIANGRAVGTFVLPGELAGYLIVFVPIAYALARVARSRALRIVATAALVVALVAMFLTFSRTGWVGLACAMAFLVALDSSQRRRSAAIGAGIVLTAIALVLLLFNARHNPSENYTRLSIWQAALGAIDRFPLTGVGPFGFSHVYPLVRQPDGDATAFHAHSMYLTMLAELGIVGFSAFVWTMWSFANELRRRLRDAAPAARTLALAVTAGIVGSLVQGLIDTVSVIVFGLLLPMLALALVAARSGTMDA